MDYSENVVTYAIDAGDRIVEVSDSWRRFAIANDGAHLADNAVGQWLWDLITVPGLRRLFQQTYKDIRATGLTFSYPFRCDSPGEFRFLRMVIEVEAGSQLRFFSLPRDPDTAVQRYPTGAGIRLIIVCDGCGNVNTGRTWVAATAALSGYDILNTDKNIDAQLGTCPSCAFPDRD